MDGGPKQFPKNISWDTLMWVLMYMYCSRLCACSTYVYVGPVNV